MIRRRGGVNITGDIIAVRPTSVSGVNFKNRSVCSGRAAGRVRNSAMQPQRMQKRRGNASQMSLAHNLESRKAGFRTVPQDILRN